MASRRSPVPFLSVIRRKLRPQTQARPVWRWAAVLLLLAAWGLRLQRLDFQDIWWDEARNIDVATRPLAQIAVAGELDIHPPLYFYLLHAWTSLTGAEAFLTRFVSLWFGVLTVALVYRLARSLRAGDRGREAALLAMALAALAPYGLAEAQETRMYTMSWAWLAAGALALWRALQEWRVGRGRRGWLVSWGPFVLLAAVSLLTHYATAIILATWGLWLSVWALRGGEWRSKLAALVATAAGVVLLCLPAAPIALRQIPGYDNPNLVLPDLPGYLAQLFRAFTLGEFVPEMSWRWGRWLWLVLPLGGALVQGVSADAREYMHRQRWSLLVVWLAGGLILFYGILIARSAFNPRYISFVLPALWALAGWALAGWRSLWRPLPWLSLALIFIPTGFSLHADLTDPAHFREDARGVVAYLQAHATPEDVILVDQRYPFGFYWPRWNNEAYGFPPAAPADVPPAQYLFVDMAHDDERRIDHRLTALAGRARQVFWVTWFESDMDPRGAVPALLDAHGRLIDTQYFRGYTVRAWQLQPPTRFRLPTEAVPLGIRFEPGVVLLAGDWYGRANPAPPAGNALVTLRWQVEAPTSRSLKVSVRLKEAGGATLAQDDRLLLNDRHVRTTAWWPGESARNVYRLTLPERPGVYLVTVVLYDEETLAAVGVADGSGIEPVIGRLSVAN
ncbi:MAG: hypothetical protein D6775_12335 [Caldilineae bacterium]|nr:MAG: hypothetical protein D6775_12335 [Caldilineae bacterium]